MYKYLFRNGNQGYWYSYTPFESNKKLTQELCDELTHKHDKSVGRSGSSLELIGNILCEYGYDLKPYKTTYRGKLDSEPSNLDPLPESFSSWDIIKGITGNY